MCAPSASGKRRALLATDGSVDTETKTAFASAARVAADVGGEADVLGVAAAAGYAACTLGVLALTGLAARRTTVVLSLKQSSRSGGSGLDSGVVAPDATAAVPAAAVTVAALDDAAGGR